MEDEERLTVDGALGPYRFENSAYNVSRSGAGGIDPRARPPVDDPQNKAARRMDNALWGELLP